MIRAIAVLALTVLPAVSLASDTPPLRILAEGAALSAGLPGDDGRAGSAIPIRRGDSIRSAPDPIAMEWSPDRPVIVSELPRKKIAARPEPDAYADGRFVLPNKRYGHRHHGSRRFRLDFDDVTIFVGRPYHHELYPVVRVEHGKGRSSVR